jgi:hypothetical protein
MNPHVPSSFLQATFRILSNSLSYLQIYFLDFLGILLCNCFEIFKQELN